MGKGVLADRRTEGQKGNEGNAKGKQRMQVSVRVTHLCVSLFISSNYEYFPACIYRGKQVEKKGGQEGGRENSKKEKCMRQREREKEEEEARKGKAESGRKGNEIG